MKPNKYLFQTFTVALAGALAGCATEQPSPHADYTYCSRYSDAPECGGRAEAPAAPAPAQAQAPAPEQPKERTVVVATVVVAEAGPPPNKAGECYTKVMLPAEWRNEPTQQLVRAGGERAEYSEPVYQDAEERVLVSRRARRSRWCPPSTGKWKKKCWCGRPIGARSKYSALYNTYFERVMETPARDVWKPGPGHRGEGGPGHREILCLVHEDATYKTVERKELFRAASKRYEDVPAEYATVKKTVLKTPESVQEVEIPAEYQTIKVRKLVKAPSR